MLYDEKGNELSVPKYSIIEDVEEYYNMFIKPVRLHLMPLKSKNISIVKIDIIKYKIDSSRCITIRNNCVYRTKEGWFYFFVGKGGYKNYFDSWEDFMTNVKYKIKALQELEESESG